jgi:20S proteasome alpha/beta subunit
VQYSFSLTTFSPSGKLVQIEYALNAVSAGATSLGIVATDGVVIATEKKLPSILVDETTVQKIAVITPHIGVVYSGMGPDFRVLVRKARKTAQTYYRLYHEHIPVAQLVRETAAVMQEFTREWRLGAGRCTPCRRPALCCSPAEPYGCSAMVCWLPCALMTAALPPRPPPAESGGVRPFGVSLLMAGFDDNGPQLYQIDPSGSYFAWKVGRFGRVAGDGGPGPGCACLRACSSSAQPSSPCQQCHTAVSYRNIP